MKFSTLRDLGTGFLGFLFYLSLSVVLILNFRPLYVYEMKSENLASVSSMTEEEILEEFLRKNRAEVISVSIFEYDEEGIMDVLREEAREEARKQALTEGRYEATLNAIKNIMDSLHVSVDKAMDILKIDIEKREQLKKLL